MLFINTRPVDRAEKLNRLLCENGHKVFNLPLLELVEWPYTDELASLYQKIPESRIIVVVSPTAAEIGMRYLLQSGISPQTFKQIRWVAVGQATADYLRQFDIQADVPRIETSEGMLQLDCFQDISAYEQVAFWRGAGGRQFMMQHLQARGIRVLNFILYSRRCPNNTVQKFQQLVAYLEDSPQSLRVLISSEASWQYWLALLESAPALMEQCHYIVLGKRLYHLLTTHQANWHHDAVSCVDNLKPETLLAQLKGK